MDERIQWKIFDKTIFDLNLSEINEIVIKKSTISSKLRYKIEIFSNTNTEKYDLGVFTFFNVQEFRNKCKKLGIRLIEKEW